MAYGIFADDNDLASTHNFDLDRKVRTELVDDGIYFFSIPVKQCSLSFAHTESDVQETLACAEAVLSAALASAAGKSA